MNAPIALMATTYWPWAWSRGRRPSETPFKAQTVTVRDGSISALRDEEAVRAEGFGWSYSVGSCGWRPGQSGGDRWLGLDGVDRG